MDAHKQDQCVCETETSNLAQYSTLAVKRVLEVCVRVCWCFTFQLGGHRKWGGTLARAVSVGRDHPKGVFSVGDEVLDGDLHLSRAAGVLHTLPASKTTAI